MSIALTLPVPLKNQLGEMSSDGQPSENDHYDCVATSLASGLQYRLKRACNGDALKDAVYGQGYQGGMAAIRYIDYCANLGIALEAINGSQDALLASLHREIEAGNPCLVTMPSLWGSAPSQPGWNPVSPTGWTHVGLACGDGAGMLRVMNPWGGFWHDGTDDYWRERLCYGQIWRVGPVRQGGTNVGIPAGWTDDGTTLIAPNGNKVVLGFRDYVMGRAWTPENQPLEQEHGAAQTEWHAQLGPGTKQIFLRTILRHNPGRENRVMETDAGAEVLTLEQKVADLQAQLAAASRPAADPVAAKALTALQSLKAALGEL